MSQDHPSAADPEDAIPTPFLGHVASNGLQPAPAWISPGHWSLTVDRTGARIPSGTAFGVGNTLAIVDPDGIAYSSEIVDIVDPDGATLGVDGRSRQNYVIRADESEHLDEVRDGWGVWLGSWRAGD